MANAGVKTLLPPKEIGEAVEEEVEVEEATDAVLDTLAQPAAPRPLLSLGGPQALAKPAAVAFLSCCSLKRTFSCTNLLRLHTASPEDRADQATTSPCLHTPCPEGTTEPSAPPATQEMEPGAVQLQQEDSSSPPPPSH